MIKKNIDGIPQYIKRLYKTVWEISQKAIIDMAANRGASICQSQSLNIHLQNANFAKLTSMHFYAWKKGLKTGMYYLRTKAATDAIKFTIKKDYKDAVLSKEISSSNILREPSPSYGVENDVCSLDGSDD